MNVNVHNMIAPYIAVSNACHSLSEVARVTSGRETVGRTAGRRLVVRRRQVVRRVPHVARHLASPARYAAPVRRRRWVKDQRET